DPLRAAAALLDEARLVTPNAAEAALLAGIPVVDEESARAAAAAICAAAVLVKGGHLPGPRARDLLRDGDEVTILDAPRVEAGPLHDTGCVPSSAIACRLALGAPLVDAVRAAKDCLGVKLAAPLAVGRGARCLV